MILITGSTDGIGLATAKVLCAHGLQIILHGRTKEKVQKIQKQIPNALTVYGDFSDLNEVRQMAKQVEQLCTQTKKPLEVLLNNAGVYMTDYKLSKQGVEMTMAINHLAHFVLTSALLPLLQQAQDPRIINVSSIAHNRGVITVENCQQKEFFTTSEFDPYDTYAASKLANIYFTQTLLKKWGIDWKNKLHSYSLHPGVITTKLLKAGFNMSGDTTESGAKTSVFLATASLQQPAPKGLENIENGAYFMSSKKTETAPQAKDPAIAEKLWHWSEQFL